MQDRALRTLTELQNSGATSRVLNLHRLYKLFGETEDHRANPFFRNSLLNRSLIVKHRVREHERDLFDDVRSVATKIIVPIDREDLQLGGRYAFVGQRGYEAVLGSVIGMGSDADHDRRILHVLDELPSFDPFLMREHLRANNIRPAATYFEISPGDLRRMTMFLQNELKALVNLTLRSGEESTLTSASALAQKLFSNSAGEDLEPLRLTLRLDRNDYVQGVFCWKGFLYYKWKLTELHKAAPTLIEQIRTVRITDKTDPETRTYLRQSRLMLIQAILEARRQIEDTLGVYDDAYDRLTAASDPLAFRDFLLKAPAMFAKLGERLGVIDHLVGFWRYRFPAGRPLAASSSELMDVFLDFESSLGLNSYDIGSWDVRPKLLAC